MSTSDKIKLRNKKTGKVKEFDVLGCFMLSDDYPNLYTEDKTYNSLAELNEKWEGYKPAEPLIKDEKIRKAVRAWADVNGLKSIQITTIGTIFLRFYGIDRGGYKIVIDFGLESDYYDDFCDEIYTITELCG